jgi:hypothetical protein
MVKLFKMPRRPNMTDEELNIWFLNQKLEDENGCWNWTGVINSGYGQVSIKGCRILCHRYSLQLFLKRPIAKNIEVRHMCHNSKCFNPTHLKEGTHAENMNDMVQAGRQARGIYLSSILKTIKRDSAKGERNNKAKLTSTQVLEIRALTTSTQSSRDIGKIYGVSGTTISMIQSGKLWKHLY